MSSVIAPVTPSLNATDREFVRDTNNPKVERVWRVFYQNPRVAFTLKQVSDLTGIGEGSVARAIRELRLENFNFEVTFAGTHNGTKVYLYEYVPLSAW